MSKLAVVDLFAGAGGLSLGFEQTGRFETKAFVEINYYARQTYRTNRGRVDVYNDITRVNYDEIREKHGEIDVVIGGPPCQGFSNANRQRNELISGNNNLVNEFIRAIQSLRPRAFVMENVKTIQSDKHRFFVARGKEEELRNLEITPNHEIITLGNAGHLSERIVQFSHNNRIEPVMLDKDALSKLHSLYRLRNSPEKMANYLNRHEKKFIKLCSEWDDLHREEWDDGYIQVWQDLNEQLGECLQNGQITEEFLNNLELIIQVQKIFSKMAEIQRNNILFQLEYVDSEVRITVETYKVFDYVVNKLRSLGYGVKSEVLKAIEFGVPQQRERCIIIGIRDADDEQVTFPKGFLAEGQYYTIRDAIEDLEEIEPYKENNYPAVERRIETTDNPLLTYLHNNSATVPNHVNTDTRPMAMERFMALEQGQSFKHLDDAKKQNYTDPKSTQNTVYLRLEYDSPSRTVVNVRKSMWIHPTRDRAVSIREAARLQSFPDTYVFKGTKDAQYQQVGNAVPPILGRAVAEQVLHLLGETVQNEISQELSPTLLCTTN